MELAATTPGGPSVSSLPSLSSPEGYVDWAVGHVIDGQYEVKELIGKGGMGAVYRVRHWAWNVDLAVKAPLARLVSDWNSRERFILEAQTWVELGVHPNIVQCWFVRESDRLPMLFLDYLPLGNLKDWRKAGRVKPGEWEKILDLVIQACTGLGYAHERGLVHRDVKPANLMLRAEEQLSGASGTFRSPLARSGGVCLCVTDFGLVKVTQLESGGAPADPAAWPGGDGSLTAASKLESRLGELSPQERAEEASLSSLTLTATGTLLGTPEYGAPEQWTQARGVGVQADIYGLGGVLFELCCGRRPFDDGVKRAPISLLVGRHIKKTPPDPRQFNPDIPADLARVILQCLEKRPELRPASMAVLREELERIYRDLAGKPYPRPLPRVGTQRADALNNKAVSLWNLGFNQRAFDAWGEAAGLDALHPETVYNRSLLQWRQSQIDDYEVLRRLTQVKTAHPHVAAYLGYFHLERFSPAQAADELEEALRYPLAARKGLVWRALGDARMYLEQFDLARSAYEQALQRMPDDREAHMRLEMAIGQSRFHKKRIRFPSRSARLVMQCSSPITAVSLSRDGHWALSAQDNCLEMWELSSGTLRWTWQAEDPDAMKYSITRLGLTAETALSLDTPNGRVWSLESGQVVAELKGRGRFLAVDAGQRTALASSGELELLQLPGLERIRFFIGHTKPILCAALSRDGKLALSGSADLTIRQWNVETGRCLRILKGHRDFVQTIAFSPDGTLALSGSKDKTVRVWLLATGDCLHVLEHRDEVRRVSFTRDSRYAVVSSWNRAQKDVLDVWDMASGALAFRRSGATEVSLLKGGPWLLAGSRFARPGIFQLWECPGGRLLRTFAEHPGEVTALAVSRDDRWALSGSSDGSLRIWELDWSSRIYEPSLVVNRTFDHSEIESNQRLFFKHLDHARERIAARDYGPASLQLVLARQVPGYTRDPRALALNADLLGRLLRRSVRAAWQLRCCSAGEGAPALGTLALTRDGAYGLSAAGRLLHLWELSSGSCLRGFTGHSAPVSCLCITADGRHAVSGSCKGGLRVWNLGSGDCLHALKTGEEGIRAVAVSDDGKRIVLTTGSRIQLWDLDSGRQVGSLEVPDGTCSGISMSADGRVALTGCDAQSVETLHVWDLNRRRLLRVGSAFRDAQGQKIDPAGMRATALVVSSDGHYALTAGLDHVLRLWDLGNGLCEACWEGHLDRVNALALTSDSRIAVSAGNDGIRVWDVASGSCLESLGGEVGPVSALGLTPDGRYTLAAGADQILRLWELDWELDPDTPAASLAQSRPKSGLLHRLSTFLRRQL